ncbi:hypothetical protein [Gloeothece verrucosa]|uniref:Uncharacterized protein n=1 Tax=Gloeothece verrucosa (strain PCC 7822) TaxID=497965 RepID=E0UMB3_GLOV7|nr:hypothetical protein [Gloeothece verrucosa]ADN18093.1 hypothetical protein Cyan7822_6293 [Gloeothece verrucosa PCC 7822]
MKLRFSVKNPFLPRFLATSTDREKQTEKILKFLENGENSVLNRNVFRRYSLEYNPNLSLTEQLNNLEAKKLQEIFIDLIHQPTVQLINWSWRIVLLILGYFFVSAFGLFRQPL